MRRFVVSAALALSVCAPASLAHAGIYTDDLSRCLVKSTTADDQNAFMVWMFTAISRHPSIKNYSNLNDAQRDQAAAKAGEMMQRLMTVDCHAETVASLKYEGSGGVSAAFEVFGAAAMRGLTTDPEVAKGMEALAQHLDESKFEALAVEAGVAKPAAK